MKKLILLLFLFGCQGAPTIRNRERCVPIITQVKENGEAVVYTATNEIVYTGKCRCRPYEWTKDHIGPIKDTVSTDHPLNYCDRMSGMRPDEWGEFVKDLEEFRIWLLQLGNP